MLSHSAVTNVLSHSAVTNVLSKKHTDTYQHDGQPIQQGACLNAWLLTWREDTRRRRDVWQEEETREEGTHKAVGEVGAWGQQDAAANLTAPPQEGPLHECPQPGSNASSSCYLCPAELTYEEGMQMECRIFTVTCTARGSPQPQIVWQLPPHLVELSKLMSLHPDGFGVTSVINVTYNLTHASNLSQPLACIAQNDRYVSVEEVELGNAQAVPSSRLTWHFYPCNSSSCTHNNTDTKISCRVHREDPGSSYINGCISFPSSLVHGKPGKYELQIKNKYGNTNTSQRHSRRHTSGHCTIGNSSCLIDPSCMQRKILQPQVPQPTPPPLNACPVTTTTATTTSTINITTAITSTTDDNTMDPFPLSITVSVHYAFIHTYILMPFPPLPIT
ncbi:hypothetical protein GWK47_053423 [Chionoecetes opilio]|uniref:Ig-like domain-containing protein n=1 Tax=Chionoecetes opilio TaxID=41210 RepID=A0A8J4Y5I2_CHIOP|nr:hypothetical protein GWK47_053423 [Chionoecetes opilio]